MSVKTDTIVRTVVLAIALINQILSTMGHNVLPFSDEEINNAVTVFITVAVSLWAWWKNNSFSEQALVADDLKDDLKTAKKDFRKVKHVTAVKAGEKHA